VGGGEESTNLAMARRILDLVERRTGIRGRIEQVADRPGHDYRYGLDGRRLSSLGWRPRIPLDAGLDATVAWIAERLSGVREAPAIA